jgi:aminoglycoside 6'-N-acetyltransferase
MRYTFRAPEWADFPLLERWLQAPEVVEWWGDPANELALLREDMDEPQMTQLIVSCDDVPFAYAQHFEVHAWPQEHLAHLPPGARAVDAFIGEPDMLGRGHGSKFLRELAEELVAGGAPLVAIDPDEDNARARKAYANAGFRGERVVETESGPVVLMIYGPVHEILSPRG